MKLNTSIKSGALPLLPEKVAERLWNQLFQKGFIIYPATGLAGTHGDAFTVAPPYTISNDEIDLLVNTLESTFIEFFK